MKIRVDVDVDKMGDPLTPEQESNIAAVVEQEVKRAIITAPFSGGKFGFVRIGGHLFKVGITGVHWVES